MTTTYTDAFTDTNGTALTAHDGGLGAWTLAKAAGAAVATIQGNKGRCVSDAVGDWQGLTCGTAIALTGGANEREVYADVTVLAHTGGSYQPLFGLLMNVGGPGAYATGTLNPTGGGIVLDLIMDGDETNVSGWWVLTLYDTDGTTVLVQDSGYGSWAITASQGRLGLACSAAGAVTAFSEPYGGGTRTTFGSIAVGTSLAELHHGWYNATYANGTTGGLDVDDFTVKAITPTVTTVAMGTGNAYVGQVAPVILTTTLGAGQTVVFGHDSGTADVSFGTVTDNGDGTYTSLMTALTAGTATTIRAGLGSIAGTGANGSFTRTSGTWTASAEIGTAYTFATGSFTVTANTTTTLTFTGNATGATACAPSVTTTMPTVTVVEFASERGAAPKSGAALCYNTTAAIAKWSQARQYAMRFGVGGAGRWQRFAVVHGAVVGAGISEVNYFALYALLVKAEPAKQRTDTF